MKNLKIIAIRRIFYITEVRLHLNDFMQQIGDRAYFDPFIYEVSPFQICFIVIKIRQRLPWWISDRADCNSQRRLRSKFSLGNSFHCFVFCTWFIQRNLTQRSFNADSGKICFQFQKWEVKRRNCKKNFELNVCEGEKLRVIQSASG